MAAKELQGIASGGRAGPARQHGDLHLPPAFQGDHRPQPVAVPQAAPPLRSPAPDADGKPQRQQRVAGRGLRERNPVQPGIQAAVR